MWSEFGKKAKFSFFRSIRMAKILNLVESDKLNKNSDPASKPATQAAVQQWKFIIDMFIQYGLIN